MFINQALFLFLLQQTLSLLSCLQQVFLREIFPSLFSSSVSSEEDIGECVLPEEHTVFSSSFLSVKFGSPKFIVSFRKSQCILNQIQTNDSFGRTTLSKAQLTFLLLLGFIFQQYNHNYSFPDLIIGNLNLPRFLGKVVPYFFPLDPFCLT